MKRKIKLGLIIGGRSGEHAVSLMSARSVLEAIDRSKYEITLIGITREGKWIAGDDPLKALSGETLNGVQEAALLGDPGRRALVQIRRDPGLPSAQLASITELDVVFPLLHGTFGEDGTVQGLLELANLPYIGAGVLGSALGMDKGVFKDLMRAHGVPVVDWIVALRRDIETGLAEAVARSEALGPYPLFTKPANLGSSVGISKCHDRDELVAGLREAAEYDRRVLVELGIDRARELEVSVLGNDDPVASVVGEVVPSGEFYSYEAKYVGEGSRLLIPAPVAPETARDVQRHALTAFRAMDCSGMARVDFLLDKDSGELYLSEVNTIPGFTKISMYPKLWEASGLPYGQLIDRLVALALERQAEKDRTKRSL